jgi:DNA-binding LacI/PurR family transcriptional regulator
MSVRKFRKSTITDVAVAAGVSKGAVSAYVSGRTSVCSAETAERIEKAISELHYSRGPVMRGARDRSTDTIGVVLHELRAYDDVLDDHYNFRLRCGIQSVMNEHELALMTYPASALNNLANYSPFVDGRVDGLLMGAGLRDTRPEKIASAGLPIVVFGRYKLLPYGCGAAFASEKDIVELAMDHFWSLGHRRIAHVSGPIADVPMTFGNPDSVHEASIWRFRHYVDWMSERRAYDPLLHFSAEDWKLSDDRANFILDFWSVLPNPPTAVFCANDQLGISLMRVARSRDLHVPGDLSIIGVDDDMRSAPAGLTTVNAPIEEVGRAGANALLDLMTGANTADCRRMIPVTELIVRNSTWPLAAKA